MTLKGRFAPSPTSDLHIGNLRTALAAWLLARSAGGRFIVRMEDLDQARVSSAGAVAHRQLEDLAKLGIDWDGEVVWQSARTSLYKKAVGSLAERTYPCFCTRREIAQAASAPHDGYRAYPGTCASLSTVQQSQLALTRSPALRIRAQGETSTISDLVSGEISRVVDDFVLVRGDGTYAYNLAVVVDDALQGVNQVCRGDDLLASAPRQAWLARQLGYEAPSYAHVSLVLNTAGKRLAKRDGAVTLTDLEQYGLTSKAVCAQLCRTLGLGSHDTPDLALQNLPADFIASKHWQTPVTFAAPRPAT